MKGRPGTWLSIDDNPNDPHLLEWPTSYFRFFFFFNGSVHQSFWRGIRCGHYINKMRHLIGSCIIDFNARGKCGNTWEWNVRRQWENVLCVSTYKLTAWLGRCMTSNNNPALFPIHFCLYITLVLGVCISLNECSTSRQNSTISICNLWKNKIKFDLLRLLSWLTREVAPLLENVEYIIRLKIYYWSERTRASDSLWNYYFCVCYFRTWRDIWRQELQQA